MTRLPCTGGQWIPPADGESHGKGDPPDNVTKMIEEQGQHGIVISGVIAWFEVHRHMAAGTIWRQVADTSWNYKDITEAKKQLLAILTPSQLELITKNKDFRLKRTTSELEARKSLEITDIVSVLEYLSDTNAMPLVMASTCQIRMSPKSLGSLSPEASLGEMATKVQSLEACLEKYMASTKQQIVTLTEIVTEQRCEKEKTQSQNAIRLSETPNKKRKLADENPETSQELFETLNERVSDMEVMEVSESQNSYARALSGIQPLRRASLTNPPQARVEQANQKQQQMLKTVLQNTLGNKVDKSEKPKSRNIFHGKAKPTETGDAPTEENNLAADVDLVAFGVNLEAETDDLKSFLIAKGINVKDVKLLTKTELLSGNKVRSKTMQVTVKAGDHEKAMNPDLWPMRVGVRYYRAPPRRSAPGVGEQGVEAGAAPVTGAGGLQERGQGGARPRGQNYRGQQQQRFPQAKQRQGRRNRFEEVDGWNVPRTTPITLENLQQVLSQFASCP